MTDQEKWNELLSFLLDTLRETKGFVVEQAPDVVRQILLWGQTKAVFEVVGAMLLWAFIVWTLLAWRKLCKSSNDFDGESPYFIILVARSVASAAAFFFAIGFLCEGIYTFFYITVAPKVYLLEQLGRMVK